MSFSLSGTYAIKKGRRLSLRPLRTSTCRGAQVALQESPILRTGTRNAITTNNRNHAASTNHPIFLRGFLAEATNHLSCGFLREAIGGIRRPMDARTDPELQTTAIPSLGGIQSRVHFIRIRPTEFQDMKRTSGNDNEYRCSYKKIRKLGGGKEYKQAGKDDAEVNDHVV